MVEAYRDDQGRPRQRVLANLHGEPDTLSALAKLAAQRELLRQEREKLAKDLPHANQFYEIVTHNALHGHRYSNDERREIGRLIKMRERLLKRLATIDAALATIQKDGAVIKRHCLASPDKVQAAIKAYQARYREAEAAMLGTEVMFRMQRTKVGANLRRLRIHGASAAYDDRLLLPEVLKAADKLDA